MLGTSGEIGSTGEMERTGEMETADRYCLAVRLGEGTAGELLVAAEICTAVIEEQQLESEKKTYECI